MYILNVLKRSLIGIALCAGLFVLPVPAHADASNEVATAAQHAGLSAASNSLLMADTHLHHTLNCLVGPKDRLQRRAIHAPASATEPFLIPRTPILGRSSIRLPSG